MADFYLSSSDTEGSIQSIIAFLAIGVDIDFALVLLALDLVIAKFNDRLSLPFQNYPQSCIVKIPQLGYKILIANISNLFPEFLHSHTFC